MHPARIAELLHPYLSISGSCHAEPAQAGEESAVLSPAQLQSISTYIDILQHWNSRINLTAIRNEEEIVTRHFGESLFAAHYLFPDLASNSAAERRQNAAHGASRGLGLQPAEQAPEGRKISTDNDQRLPLACSQLNEETNIRLADLGSGAGFPGIPIKLWAPNISLTLIESNHKKATFLREVARALTLTDVNIQNARAETLPPSTFDVVTLRAVERFASTLPIAATLLAPAGRLALLIASSQLDITRSVLPTFSWHAPIQIPASRSRLLLVGQPG